MNDARQARFGMCRRVSMASWDPCLRAVAASTGSLTLAEEQTAEVIALRVFLDLDIESTARELGVAPGTVRAHQSRAMAALRKELIPTLTTHATVNMEAHDEPL